SLKRFLTPLLVLSLGIFVSLLPAQISMDATLSNCHGSPNWPGRSFFQQSGKRRAYKGSGSRWQGGASLMDDLILQEPTSGLTPHLAIGAGHAAEAIDFYKKAFGAQEVMRHAADDGRLMHAHLKINGHSLMMHDHFAEHHGGQELPDPAGVMLH